MYICPIVAVSRVQWVNMCLQRYWVIW